MSHTSLCVSLFHTYSTLFNFQCIVYLDQENLDHCNSDIKGFEGYDESIWTRGPSMSFRGLYRVNLCAPLIHRD